MPSFCEQHLGRVSCRSLREFYTRAHEDAATGICSTTARWNSAPTARSPMARLHGFDNKIYLSLWGKQTLNRHVGSRAATSRSREWYFVAPKMEKTSPRMCVLHLFVNAEPVAELKTKEKVNYDTSKMWTEIGPWTALGAEFRRRPLRGSRLRPGAHLGGDQGSQRAALEVVTTRRKGSPYFDA